MSYNNHMGYIHRISKLAQTPLNKNTRNTNCITMLHIRAGLTSTPNIVFNFELIQKAIR